MCAELMLLNSVNRLCRFEVPQSIGRQLCLIVMAVAAVAEAAVVGLAIIISVFPES